MKRMFVIAVAGATAVAGLAETAPRAQAAEATSSPRTVDAVRQNALAAMNSDELQEVRWRGKRGWRGGHRWRNGRWHGRRHYRRGRGNAAVAAGVAGLAAGAIIAGSAARAHRSGPSKRWCANRYRSYDWRSGTYLGYDGARHACP